MLGRFQGVGCVRVEQWLASRRRCERALRRRSGGQVEACLPFSEYRIGAITVEHNYEEPKRTRIRQLLEANGYRLDRVQLVEDWYVLASPE